MQLLLFLGGERSKTSRISMSTWRGADMKRNQLKEKHEPNQYVIYRRYEFIACHFNVEYILTFFKI